MDVVREVYNCDGIRVGSIVRNEHGGTFFVQAKRMIPGVCRSDGINWRYMMGQRDSSVLKRQFC